ncbi:protein phosphatase 2C [Violaceomyces palustris]|uniref:Protein phosphatase 2C n=1 Tax=Violaceomyces palustris TaxID=1673888 RepID=A0ACD0NR65_9BASI|nr:protein phosphatase 2C [Violaceomyces palustris]
MNAFSKAQTVAEGSNTYGIVNQHPVKNATESDERNPAFRVGVSEDRNKRWRRTMEDSHAFVYNFGGVFGQGFFGIFDGHAGKHAAEWCGKHFHEYLSKALILNPGKLVPDVLNSTFHDVDRMLSQLASAQGTSSGCTAVTAFLRLEDEDGRPNSNAQESVKNKPGAEPPVLAADDSGIKKASGSIFSGLARRIRSTSSDSVADEEASSQRSREICERTKEDTNPGIISHEAPDGLVDIHGKGIRRVLYTANVGDARAVLCRAGRAIRLTYDHKGSDAQEAKRITDAGGFVMNNRVNGVLAVTRSLGDSSMKEFVVGSPYTTETTLSSEDTFLIVACDGLWDVVDDQEAVDLIQQVYDPQRASEILLQHALSNFSTDNTSVMVVRFSAAAG